MTARPRPVPQRSQADLSALLGAGPIAHDLQEVVRLVGPTEIVPGWATTDLERAAGPAAPLPTTSPLPTTTTDHLLGARAVVIELDLQRARRVVLLEPSTEGPLAAALARHGEGWIAAYLRGSAPDVVDRLRIAGLRLSAEGPGPLGPQRRVRVGPRDGPFVLLVGPDPR